MYEEHLAFSSVHHEEPVLFKSKRLILDDPGSGDRIIIASKKQDNIPEVISTTDNLWPQYTNDIKLEYEEILKQNIVTVVSRQS